MRSGRSAACADRTDFLAFSNPVAFAHIDAIHVQHGRRETMSVVEDNGPACVIHIVVDHRHDGVGGRDDGCAGRGCDINAVMRAARLPVEHALAAVDAGNAPNRRPHPSAFE